MAIPEKTTSKLTIRDHIGHIMVRLGIRRMKYSIEPGLYSLNNPGKEAPLLVTVNYKLSFDHLRKAMGKRPCHILVLNTKGINVWCAAGKGSFGTEELIFRVNQADLKNRLSHKTLILPQLGAPGIQAHEVTRQLGMKVIYGPVMAKDLPAFLDNESKATKAMRKKDFPLKERALLVPLEVVQGMLPMLGIAMFSTLLSLLLPGFEASRIYEDVLPPMTALLAGAIITPLLLPWVPFRAFAAKGALLGFLCSLVLLSISNLSLSKGIYTLFLTSAGSSFFAMNFTGASTFTSLSGVVKEMKLWVPIQIGALVLGVSTRIALSLLGGF